MDQAMQRNGAPWQMKNVHNSADSPGKTACGNLWCECSRIMAHLDLIKTPYFTVVNPDKRRGPTLPDQFVQEHGDEAIGNVILDSARTAGKIVAVEFVKDLDQKTGEIRSIRMGDGWESFMAQNQLQPEDLLVFMLQGKARFIVMMVRGHSREAKHQAEPADQRTKGKRKECDTGDELDLEVGTAELWRAAKKHVVMKFPADTFVTRITSDDAFDPYYTLLSDSESSSAKSDECSDFEDESEFRGLRYLLHKNWTQ